MSGQQTPEHLRHKLDDHLSSVVRLCIVAMLAKVEEAEFQIVRDAVEVNDSVLSKQITTLENVGYLATRKGYVGKRPRTWLSITPAGRTALKTHVATLQLLLGGL
jgi:DNA-binding HxlR family transcriptional regulator